MMDSASYYLRVSMQCVGTCHWVVLIKHNAKVMVIMQAKCTTPASWFKIRMMDDPLFSKFILKFHITVRQCLDADMH